MANRKQELDKAVAESKQIVAERSATPVVEGPKKPKIAAPNRRKQITAEVPAGFHDFLKTLPKDHPFHDLANKNPEALGREIARVKEIAKGKATAAAGRAAVSGEGQRSQAQFDPESKAGKAVRERRAAPESVAKKEEPTVEVVQPSENRGRVVPLSGEAARQAIEIARSKGKPKKEKAERKPGYVETGLDPNSLFGGNIANGGQGRTKINPRRGY